MNNRAARLLVILVVLLTGCGSPPGRPRSETAREPRPAVRSTLAKSDFVLADPEGRWRWEASAASAEMDEAAGTSRLSRVKGTYFLKDRAALRLRADRGRLDRKQEKALLEGKVQGESLLTGAKLRADRVEIDLKAMRLEARGKVRIELGAAVLSGESFSADIGLKKIWAGGEESPRPGGGKK